MTATQGVAAGDLTGYPRIISQTPYPLGHLSTQIWKVNLTSCGCFTASQAPNFGVDISLIDVFIYFLQPFNHQIILTLSLPELTMDF